MKQLEDTNCTVEDCFYVPGFDIRQEQQKLLCEEQRYLNGYDDEDDGNSSIVGAPGASALPPRPTLRVVTTESVLDINTAVASLAIGLVSLQNTKSKSDSFPLSSLAAKPDTRYVGWSLCEWK